MKLLLRIFAAIAWAVSVAISLFALGVFGPPWLNWGDAATWLDVHLPILIGMASPLVALVAALGMARLGARFPRAELLLFTPLLAQALAFLFLVKPWRTP